MSCPWKDAIIDACVVNWIFTKAYEENPRLAVNDLLCWQQKMALDPMVSKPAYDLVEALKACEEKLRAIGEVDLADQAKHAIEATQISVELDSHES